VTNSEEGNRSQTNPQGTGCR